MNNMHSFRALIENSPYTRKTKAEYFQPRADLFRQWMLKNNNNPVDYKDILNNLNIFEGDDRDVALCANLIGFMDDNDIIIYIPNTHPKKIILKNT